jgi:kumamolisin
MQVRANSYKLPGTTRKAVPNAEKLQRSNPNQKIRVSIYVRQNPEAPRDLVEKARRAETDPISHREYLQPAEFEKVFGANKSDIKAVEDFAKSSRLKVIDSSPAMRRILVEGPISEVESAFGVELNDYHHDEIGEFRGRTGDIYVPEALAGRIVGVEGLDTRPVGRPRRFRGYATLDGNLPKSKAALVNKWPGTFFPTQVAGLYNYPAGQDGTGQNIAIFAFNGAGSQDPRGGYSAAALKTYFVNVLKGKMPSITDVVVQGQGNVPGPDTQTSSNNGDSTGEVMLDLCVAGSVAPGSRIFVYFTEFTAQGWVDAVNRAVTDNNNISVISISYGNPEDDPRSAWTKAGIMLVDQAFQAAKAKGITICCASGDDGSSDQASSGAHADFPASSPSVLGVGGTKLVATNGSNATIASEVVWNELNIPRPAGAGGGGISAIFPKPSYQNSANVPPSANAPHIIGRGVPDVAAVADPFTGVVVMHVSGKKLEPIGGTSAAAPLWASLICRLNQGLNNRIGFFNPVLYSKLSSGVLNDTVEGNNGAYSAGPGWDACTGFGSPDGEKILHALKGS